MTDLIQIRMNLDYTHPEIYRVVVVSKEITFLDLHHIIQISMGWKNQHLFGFLIDGYRVGIVTDNFILGENILDCTTTKLSDLIAVDDEFKYEYDFGDGWVHTIKVENFDDLKITPKQIPYCIKGKMKCPPENCGGILGYFKFLNSLSLENIEFRNYVKRTGDFYDPKKFSKVIVNRRLRNIDGYLKIIGNGFN